MWRSIATLFAGRSVVEYVRASRADREYHGSLAGEGTQDGWQISGEDDSPVPHPKDLPDDRGARLLRDLLTSEALKDLAGSYDKYPIFGTKTCGEGVSDVR
jgi:hypothetical protein